MSNPEIRFKRYSEDWRKVNLSSLVDKLRSYSLSRKYETQDRTGYKYVHYGDIHTKVANIINESSDLPSIESGNYDLLQNGDLILADASEDYQGIAMPAVVTSPLSYNLVAGLHTIALRPKNVDSLFLYYLIQSSVFRKYGYRIGTGMKVFGISSTNILKFEGNFPSVKEQKQIGNVFKQLDELIELHQHALSLLKQRKKAFLQKCFPKKGKSIPEFRFKEFNDKWLIDKFDNLVIKVSEKSKSKTLPKVEFEDIVSGEGRLNKDISKKFDDRKGTLFEPNYILFGKLRPYLKNWLFTDFHGVALGDFWVLKPIKINPLFLYYLIQTEKYQTVANLSSGTKMPRSNWKTVSETNFYIPNKLEEQEKIGIFFKELDNSITLQKEKIESLKQMKKAFLQKMFV